MTDDINHTPKDEMDGQSAVSVQIRSDAEGHWVDWAKNDQSGTLGPYVDPEMATTVQLAKERELNENAGSIDDAVPPPPR